VDVVELLLPELRKRGLFWDDYTVKGGTYRENLYGKKGVSAPPEDHPASKYQWRAGVAKEDHVIPSEPQSNGANGSVKRPRDVETSNSEKKTRKSARIAA
jgi:hypothetical protein